MNKTVIALLVGIVAFFGAMLYSHDFAYKKGREYQRNEDLNQPAKRDMVTVREIVALHDTVTKIVKSVEVVFDTVFESNGLPVIREYVETPSTIGNLDLGASFTLRDYGNRYEFLNQAFHYPSRTITETKFLPEPEYLYRGCKFALDLSSEFKRFDLRLAPKVGLEFQIEGTRVFPYLGCEFSNTEPKYIYGIGVTW